MKRALLAIALLLIPTLALAQAETTGRVTGNVLDEDRKPVAGAEITLESPALQGQRKAVTDANGRYLSSLLPPGVYTMTVNAPGKTPLQYTFRVGLGQTVPIDAVLKSGADLVEDVVVFSPATKLETTAGGENFNFDSTINELPVTNRTLENVATLAPNVSFGPTPGTLSISGAPSFDTVVLLDGSEVSDPYFGSAPTIYLEEAIEEMQVLTSGVNAKYGRFQGGVINATTKSGGNTFDGSARVDFNKQSWNSKSPYGESQSDDLNKVYSATFGGPILKDHLWFFLGGRTIPEQATAATTVETGESFTSVRNEDRWQVKLTGAITPNHVIEGSYLEYTADTANRAGLPAGDLLALGKRSDPRDIKAADYQGVLTDRMFLNIQATQKNVQIQSGGDPAKGDPFLDFYGSGFQIFHNHWWDFTDPSVRDNETAAIGLTNVFATESWGDHTLEYGIQYVNSITSGQNIQSSTGFNFLNYDALFGYDFSDCSSGTCLFNVQTYYGLDPATGGLSYRWEAIPFSGDQTLKNTAAYIQDSWEIDKWRLDLGLRYDDYQGKGPFPTLDLDFQEISPRVGVTYNVTPDWQLQAAWGKYVSRFNDNVASNITGVGGAPYIVSIYTGPTQTGLTYDQVQALNRNDANFGIITTISDPSQPTRYVAPGTGAPYAEDFNLSVKRALPRNTGSFTMTYTKREFKDLLDDFVGDQVVNGSPYSTVDDPKGSGASFDFDNEVWKNCGICRRDYDAIAATVEYRPSARWDIGGNYTYSRTRGNYEGEGRNTPASGSIIGNYPRSVDQATAFPYGWTDDDIRHRVRGWGNYRFDFGRAGNLSLGGIFWYRSGANWSKTAGVGLTSDASYLNESGSFTKYFEGRGNERFGGFWNLDTTIKYQINFWRDLGMYVKFDVLNITNEDSLVLYDISGQTVSGSNPPRWEPRRANLDTGLCQTLIGGVPGTATFPSRDCRNFGRIRNENDYQTPRQYFVSVGLVW